MVVDGGGGGSNPYAEQTAQNTKKDWLDHEPVDLDLDGMREFGQRMGELAQYLTMHSLQVQALMPTLPLRAWVPGPALPEAQHMSDVASANYDDFVQYLYRLGQTISNIGMAAHSIADIFAGTDGWSAASLGAIQWVLGEHGAKRPSSVPEWILNKTVGQEESENLAKNSPEGSPLWTITDRQSWYGTMTTTASGPDGMSMVIFDRPGSDPGTRIRVTTIYDADGNTVSSRTQTTVTRTVGNTVTTTVSTEMDGKQQGSTETVVTTENGQVTYSSTTNRDANGHPSGMTELTTNGDGSQTQSTYQSDGDGGLDPTPTRVIAFGPQTAGPEPAPPDTAPDTIDQLRNEDDDGVPG